jgi:hypothetical protein
LKAAAKRHLDGMVTVAAAISQPVDADPAEGLAMRRSPMRDRRRTAVSLIALALAATVTAVAQRAAPPAPVPATLAPDAQAEVYLDAIRKGDVAAVQRALDGGVPADTPFRYNRTALSFAADRGHVEVVRLLLAKGANPDAADTFYNQTALDWAARGRNPGCAEVVKLLLEKGATGRERALRSAIGNDDARMVQTILDAGGIPPAQLSEALADAKTGGKTASAALLEKAGATMPAAATLTPEQLARYPGTYNDGTRDVVLSLKAGVVVANFGPQTFRLSPRSETAFVLLGPGSPLTFVLEGGRVVGFTITNQASQSTVYKRVNP